MRESSPGLLLESPPLSPKPRPCSKLLRPSPHARKNCGGRRSKRHQSPRGALAWESRYRRGLHFSPTPCCDLEESGLKRSRLGRAPAYAQRIRPVLIRPAQQATRPFEQDNAPGPMVYSGHSTIETISAPAPAKGLPFTRRANYAYPETVPLSPIRRQPLANQRRLAARSRARSQARSAARIAKSCCRACEHARHGSQLSRCPTSGPHPHLAARSAHKKPNHRDKLLVRAATIRFLHRGGQDAAGRDPRVLRAADGRGRARFRR